MEWYAKVLLEISPNPVHEGAQYMKEERYPFSHRSLMLAAPIPQSDFSWRATFISLVCSNDHFDLSVILLFLCTEDNFLCYH